MRKLLTALLVTVAIGANAQVLPYQNPQLSAEQRADDLLGRLTLDEKVKLMMDTSPAIPRLGIPQFQWWNEASQWQWLPRGTMPYSIVYLLP